MPQGAFQPLAACSLEEVARGRRQMRHGLIREGSVQGTGPNAASKGERYARDTANTVNRGIQVLHPHLNGIHDRPLRLVLERPGPSVPELTA